MSPHTSETALVELDMSSTALVELDMSSTALGELDMSPHTSEIPRPQPVPKATKTL